MYSSILDRNVEILYNCTVLIIDEIERIQCTYKSYSTGRHLLMFICKKFDIEDDYQKWGFTFNDPAGRKRWLKMEEAIRPHIRHLSPPVLKFQLHFYPLKPYKIFNDQLRRMILRQLRYDLGHCLLVNDANDAAMLVALTLQCLYGDFNPLVHAGNYVKVRVIKNQTIPVEVKAMQIHKENLGGLNQIQAEDLLLRMICKLPSYGKDFYRIKDEHGAELQVGFDRQGIVVNLNITQLSNIQWANVEKVTQQQNNLCFHMWNGEIMNLSCLSSEECNYIYDRAIEQQVLHSVTADLHNFQDSLDVDEQRTHFTDNRHMVKQKSLFFDPRVCALIIIIFSVIIYWYVLRVPLSPKPVKPKTVLELFYQKLFDRPHNKVR